MFEEHKLRVFENRVLGNVFGPTRYEVTEGWRKLHIESFKICVITYYMGDKEQKMGIACDTFGGRGAMHTRFGLETWRKETTWKGVNE